MAVEATARRDPEASDSNEESDENGAFGGYGSWRFRGGDLVVQTFADFTEAAIGGVITTASADLARFVAEAVPDGTWQDTRCLELGSGCGLVSSTLLQLGARVFASEQEDFLDHLAYNLQMNEPAGAVPADKACVVACDWGSEESRAQLRAQLGRDGAHAIFAANCVYDPETVVPFLETIAAAMGPDSAAFMCGVPVPKERHEGGSILDAFLSAAPGHFDMHLLDFPTGKPQLRDDEERRWFEPTGPVNPGPAAAIAAQHGVSEAALADGVWLILQSGVRPPSWLPPALLTLASER